MSTVSTGIRLRSGTRLWAAPDDVTALMMTEPAAYGVHIRPSEWGLGAFATREIAAGTVLGAYGGELLTKAEVTTRANGGAYVLQLGNGLYRDAADPTKSNWLRYINSTHGTRRAPNVTFERNGVLRVARRVRVGEELLACYGRTYSWERSSPTET